MSGPEDSADPEPVVDDGWMESKSHRENLLARKFRRMSVVARKGDDGRWYICQLFGKKA